MHVVWQVSNARFSGPACAVLCLIICMESHNLNTGKIILVHKHIIMISSQDRRLTY